MTYKGYHDKEARKQYLQQYMRNYRRIHKNRVMLAYWAGFIDADGTIKIIKRRAGKKRINSSYIPYLSVANTKKHIITEAKEQWGCGSIWHKKPFKPNHKDAWAWYVSSKKCIVVVKQILPYLKVKRPQAELLIEFYERCEFKPCGKKGTSSKVVKLREQYRQKMLVLNKRGR